MDNRSKILFVSHSAELYGAEKSLLDLILGLDQKLFKPVVLSRREGPLIEILLKNNIETLIFPFDWWVRANFVKTIYRAIKLIVHLKKIKDRIKQINPDLIYTNTSVIPIGGILAVTLKIPHIWHVREFVQEGIGYNFDFGNSLSMKFMSYSSKRIICNSEAVKQKFSKYIPTNKLVVVYNGILNQRNTPPPPKVVPSKNRVYSLCLVGKVGAHKGHSDAIRSIGSLKEKGIRARLRIVGDGSDFEIERLKDLSRQLHISEEVVFEGFKKEINSVFLNSDITLICSMQEAFGRVAVESMAAGTPVIGTNSGGLPEIIEDGKTGFLYIPGDISSLVEKIQILLNNSSIYNLFSREGYLSVYRKFTKQRYIADIERIICKTIDLNH